VKSLLAALALVLASGCSAMPGCSVGMSLLPLGPMVMCYVDASPDTDEDDDIEEEVELLSV
jgi:hypothetical protein